jgi:hypothetical protein
MMRKLWKGRSRKVKESEEEEERKTKRRKRSNEGEGREREGWIGKEGNGVDEEEYMVEGENRKQNYCLLCQVQGCDVQDANLRHNWIPSSGLELERSIIFLMTACPSV